MKEAYYFSHDANARHDPKCSALIADYGMEGYGVFWMLIEIMAEQRDYKLEKFPKLYEGLARQMRLEADRVRSIIEAMLHDYELLLQDEKSIWSESLLRRMEIKDAKRQAKVEAGRLGGIQSGIVRAKRSKTKQCLKQNEANEAKESKVKESKVKESTSSPPIVPPEKIKFGEFVSLTQDEHNTLVERYGQGDTERMIDILDNYKGARGKRYKSDYRAILSWVVARLEEEREKRSALQDASGQRVPRAYAGLMEMRREIEKNEREGSAQSRRDSSC